MGYRSDVIVAMKQEKFKELLKTVDDNLALDIFEGSDTREKKEWILLSFHDVKWYDEYKDVKAIMDFINNMDDDDFEYHRLGEEPTDYEVLGGYCSPFNICMNRSLDFDG